MEILHVSAECYPAAKVGGLADVAGALPKYLNKTGADASLVMPHYHNKFYKEHGWEEIFKGDFKLGSTVYNYHIRKERSNALGFDLYIVEIPGLLLEEMPYGYSNDMQRHLGFQISVVDWISRQEHRPDVIHCHDHPTGLIPFMMNYCYRYNHLKDIPTVFTIHSAQYQGNISLEHLHLVPYFDDWKSGMLEWDNQINPMAAAIKCCWKFTTVSPSYMKELEYSALGLQSLISAEKQKARGILNGIDAEVWNPETDVRIEVPYNVSNVNTEKIINKKALCDTFELTDEKPLAVFIGRLANEKGGDLLAKSIRECINQQNGEMNYLVLGSGAKNYEDELNALKEKIPGNFNCYIGFHENLAHLMYAGADFLLMPSYVEPCGLNQLYGLRYGTVPVVRSTGGLIDTVKDISEYDGFGIRFDAYSVEGVSEAMNRALALYGDENRLSLIRKMIMELDHSWEHAAGEYLQLYEGLH